MLAGEGMRNSLTGIITLCHYHSPVAPVEFGSWIMRFNINIFGLPFYFGLMGLWSTQPVVAQIRPVQPAGQTRAVIVGVSEYQDSRIPRLQFSHRDAEAFAEWLLSPAGGNVPPDNIRVLTNADATFARMGGAYTWLLENTKPGDVAILYFSGHGDMENQTISNNGYLLAYDMPANNYMIGGFPLHILQGIIRTLSTKNQAQVMVYTDACRAGALAGSEYAGTQATAKALVDQYASEVKVLSCQPTESSNEGPQWGGGHGVFTWYLLDGLTGLADRNEDLKVSLLELQRFLEDHVPAAVSPRSQIPLVTGDKGLTMSRVDPDALAGLRERKAREASAPPDSVWREKGIPARMDTDSTVMVLYRRFGEALRQGQLLEPDGASAWDIYQRIHTHERMAPYRLSMRLDLAAALQDESQRAINDYLAASPAELQRRWSHDQRYALYPDYLQHSATLLGNNHFLYPEIRRREAYFRGLHLRLEAERTGDTSLLRQAREWQYLVLDSDSTAAYAWNETGLLARRENRLADSEFCFRQALAYSPTWTLARANLGGLLVATGRPEEGIRECERALEREPAFALAHFNAGLGWFALRDYEKAIHHFEAATRHDPSYSRAWMEWGLALWKTARFEDAAVLFAKGDSLARKDILDANGWLLLGKSRYYRDLDQPALEALRVAIRVDPGLSEAWYYTGLVFTRLGQTKEALDAYRRCLDLDSLRHEARFNLGYLLIGESDFEAACPHFSEVLRHLPDDAFSWVGLTICHTHRGEVDQALETLEKALSLGYDDREFLASSALLADIRPLPGFKGLMAKYLPR